MISFFTSVTSHLDALIQEQCLLLASTHLSYKWRDRFRTGKSLMHAVRAVAENRKPSLSGPISALFLLLHGPFFPIRAHAEVLQGGKLQKKSQSSVNDEPSLSVRTIHRRSQKPLTRNSQSLRTRRDDRTRCPLKCDHPDTLCVLKLIRQVWFSASWIFCFPQRANMGKETDNTEGSEAELLKSLL